MKKKLGHEFDEAIARIEKLRVKLLKEAGLDPKIDPNKLYYYIIHKRDSGTTVSPLWYKIYNVDRVLGNCESRMRDVADSLIRKIEKLFKGEKCIIELKKYEDTGVRRGSRAEKLFDEIRNKQRCGIKTYWIAGKKIEAELLRKVADARWWFRDCIKDMRSDEVYLNTHDFKKEMIEGLEKPYKKYSGLAESYRKQIQDLQQF